MFDMQKIGIYSKISRRNLKEKIVKFQIEHY